MASRYMNYPNKTITEPRFLEMVIMKRSGDTKEVGTKVVMLDGDRDAVQLAQEDMNEIIANIVRTEKMENLNRKKLEENASLFQKNLEPWFSLVATTEKSGHLLDKLSNSLKKALILITMERYNCNSESVAKVLGLTPERLQKEMALCGIGGGSRKAA